MKQSFSLKSFVRFLGRNKLYTAINLFGFSVSLMFVILIAAYTEHEFTFDKFQKNKDRIFLMDASMAIPVGDDLKNRYPEIEDYISISWGGKKTILSGDEKMQGVVNYVSPSFFTQFSFPLLQGDPEHVFDAKNSVVLVERFARKLFGDEQAVGKEIVLDGQSLTVTGVLAGIKHTSLSDGVEDVLVHYETNGQRHSYNAASSRLYLVSRTNADLLGHKDDMLEYLKQNFWVFQNNPEADLVLTRLDEVHMSGRGGGNPAFVYTLLSIGILILVFSVINYINLSVAQSGFRAREMATRRLLGGTRPQLFRSVVTESLLLCSLSFAFGGLLAFACQSSFNSFFQSDVNLTDYCTPWILLGCIGFVALLGIVSGTIPALAISRFRPIEVVRGELVRKTRMIYSKVFITFQYFISIALIGLTIVMLWQVRFMNRYDLGLSKENIIVIDNERLSPAQVQAFMTEAARLSGVVGTSAANNSPYSNKNILNRDSRSDPENPIDYRIFFTDTAFIRLLGLKILHDNHNSSADSVWLNETAYRVKGLPADAQDLKVWGEFVPLAGMVADFRYRNLTTPVGPAVIVLRSNPLEVPANNIFIKISGNDPAALFSQIRAVYEKVSNGEIFTAGFADEQVQNWYEGEQRMSKIIGSMTLIAIVISTLGILAMSMYFIRQRATEIAVKKIYGSTNREILLQLIGRFMVFVLAGFVLAIPVIWYAAKQWLQNYIERIPVNWLVFVAAGIVAAAIALLTVYWQSWRAANANPVESLKK